MNDSDILGKLEEMERTGQVAGMIERKVRVVVWFYPWAVKDELASKREGRTIYHDADYAARRAIGDKDYMSGPATKDMISQYPEEWAHYQRRLVQPKTSIRFLPGAEVHPSILKYCEDAGLHAIEDLAQAEELQPELHTARLLAQRWVAMSKEPVQVAKPVAAATKRRGRIPGSKNKPKAVPHVQDTQTAA
jgi:hypothetical protein